MLLTLVLSVVSVFAQKGEVVEKEIKFAKGKSSATVKGVVQSRLDSHIFHVKARAGQTLTVTMASPRPLRDAHLCVVFPGVQETYCEKRKYVLTLPENGDYEIYIEAIREPIPYTITVSIK